MAKVPTLKDKIYLTNHILLILCFFVLTLGEIPRLSINGFGSIRILDIIVVFTVISSLFVFPSKLFSSFPIKIFLIFVLVNLVSLTVSYFSLKLEVLTGLIHFLRLLIYFGLYPSVYLFIQKVSKAKLIDIIVLVGGFISVLGFIQLIVIPDIGFLAQYGWDPHRNRMVSTWLDPNFLSGFLIISLAALLSQLNSKLNSKDRKIAQISLLTIIVFGILLTFSRSGLVSLAVLVFLVGIRFYRKTLIVSMLAMVIVALSFAPIRVRLLGIINPDITASARLISWSESIKIGAKSPIIGIGYNNYSYYKNNVNNIEQKNSSFGADSSILLIFSTTGILGLISFIGLFIYSIIKGFRRKTKESYIFSSIILALIIGSNFNNLLLYPLIIPCYLVVLAIINERK